MAERKSRLPPSRSLAARALTFDHVDPGRRPPARRAREERRGVRSVGWQGWTVPPVTSPSDGTAICRGGARPCRAGADADADADADAFASEEIRRPQTLLRYDLLLPAEYCVRNT